MKLLEIVFNDIKKFLLQKPFVFIILILSLIITSFTFSLFIADRMNAVSLIRTANNATNKYCIENKKGINNEKIIKLDNWLKDNHFEGYKINLYSDIQLVSDNATFLEEEIPQENLPNGSIGGVRVQRTEGVIEKPYNLIIGTTNTLEHAGFVGRVINEDDMKNKSNYAMIDYNSSMCKNNLFILNDAITIRNKEYIVRAIGNVIIYPQTFKSCNIYNYSNTTMGNIETVIIPFTTFLNNNFSTYSMDAIIPDSINNKEREAFSTFLSETFNTDNISEPQKVEKADVSDVSQYILLFSILIILALINILALFLYWVDINWRKYMIYRICGANKTDILKLILIEAIIITVFSIIIGNIFYYMSTVLFNTMFVNIIDLCIFQLIIVLLVIALVGIEGAKLLKISPRYMKRR